MPKESGEMSHKDKHQFTNKVMEQTSPNKGAVKVGKTKKIVRDYLFVQRPPGQCPGNMGGFKSFRARQGPKVHRGAKDIFLDYIHLVLFSTKIKHERSLSYLH